MGDIEAGGRVWGVSGKGRGRNDFFGEKRTKERQLLGGTVARVGG